LITSAALLLGISAMRSPANNVRATVTFDVAVTDKDGNPVVGLQKEDFRVFEDNVEQTITSFRPRRDPLAIVILAEFTDAYYTAGLGQSPTMLDFSVREPGSLARFNEAGNMLRDIAQATGGLAFFPQFGGQYNVIAPTVNADLRHQYMLRFNSSSTKTGEKL